MSRPRRHLVSFRSSVLLALTLGVLPLAAAGCSTASSQADEAPAPTPVIAVQTVTVVSEPITRTVRVTGSLIADEQAEVSAEVNGRIVSTPVELGTRVAAGAALVVISREQASAQMAEAQANAAQSAAALGIVNGAGFDPEKVPDVANAKAQWQLAESEHKRMQSLLDQKVVSQAEYDQLQHQGRGRPPAVRGVEERRAAALPGTRRRKRSHLAGAEGAERHHRPRPLRRHRRRASRQRGRLRDDGHAGRDGRPVEPAAPGA